MILSWCRPYYVVLFSENALLASFDTHSIQSRGLETKDIGIVLYCIVLYLDSENRAVRSVVGTEIILQLILLINHDRHYCHHSSRVRPCGPVSPSSESLFKGLPSLFIDKCVY